MSDTSTSAATRITEIGSTTLAELIRDRPGAAAVLDRLGLDFCCHGDQTLGEACGAAGLSPEQVQDSIEAIASPAPASEAWTLMGPEELADHIETVHHNWLDSELPDLRTIAGKVRSVHAAQHPELDTVCDLVDRLVADLVPHLRKEERLLFPAIRLLARGVDGFSFGSVAGPISVTAGEHETIGELLVQLRRATQGYTIPDDGCASYRLLYQRLQALEADTHLHVFKENSILFPAAVQLEQRLAERS